MRNRKAVSRERVPIIELIGVSVAVLTGLLGLAFAVRAVIVAGPSGPSWFACLVFTIAALGAMGAAWAARLGNRSLGAWLLVAVTAALAIVASTLIAPSAFMLLWPLYLLPIVIAQIVLGSRAGLIAGIGAPLMFVLTSAALAEQPELFAQAEAAIILNVALYALVATLVHVTLTRMTQALHRAEDAADSKARARVELREREEQFRALAESSATGIVIQQDGRLVYGNPHFFAMAQCISSDGFGLSLWDFFDEAAAQELQAQLRRRQALGGSVQPSLVRFKPLKGSELWCEVAVAEAMFWQKPAVVANVLDVSERVRAQLEMQRERDFSNNIINTAEAIIMATDADGRMTLLNPAGERITGYSFAELRERPYWEVLVAEESREAARRAFAAAWESPSEAEEVWMGRQGDEITISWHFVAQRDARGEVTGVVGVGIDVTQQRILERQAMVTERLRSLGQIAGGVAHDLNNMLAGIIGPTDLLLLMEEDATRQRALNGIMAAATRGAETVRRIQSFSKARTDLDKQVFDLRELTEDVIFSLRPRWRDAAQRQGIRIDIHNTVPAELMVHASSGEIGNVLMNLIVNACEAMRDDGEIRITGDRHEGFVEFQVADTGSGMSAETMADIFQPFFSTKGADNSGLGLAVIHGIILRHGGTITVDSEFGKGTTFTVQLPAAAPAEATPQAATGPVSPGERMRVLVVDDVPDIADYIRTVAERMGHAAVSAHDGETALRLLQQETYDVLITDYGMEGMSGTQLAEKARHLHPGIKIVLVTGWDVSSEEIEGFAGLLKKPCTRVQVEKMLHSLVSPAA